MPGLTRRGGTLAELIVALVLATIVSALGAVAMVGADRHARRTIASRDDDRIVREAAEIIDAELGASWGDSLQIRGDSAVDVLSHVGVSVACVVSGASVVLPPAVSVDTLPWSMWRTSPEAGDRLVAWDATTAGWRWATIDSVASRSDGAGCTPASGFVTRTDSALHWPVFVLRLDQPFRAGTGAPVRVLRSVRWVLYRSSDHAWWLGARRCDVSGCGSAQPVTGPLASATDSGVVFAWHDSVTFTARFRTPAEPDGRRARRILSLPVRDRVVPE